MLVESTKVSYINQGSQTRGPPASQIPNDDDPNTIFGINFHTAENSAFKSLI